MYILKYSIGKNFWCLSDKLAMYATSTALPVMVMMTLGDINLNGKLLLWEEPSQVLQRMLKVLPSWPNELSVPAEHDVNTLGFFARNYRNIMVNVVSWLFQRGGICFIHFIF
jgi:hypothetical protein